MRKKIVLMQNPKNKVNTRTLLQSRSLISKRKVFFPNPTNLLNLIDSSNLPNPLEVALKKIDQNARRLKLIPVSLGHKNSDYPDFFCDFKLPLRVSLSFFGGAKKPVNPNRPGTTLADDIWHDIYTKRQKSKYLTKARETAGKGKPRRPQRPPAGKVLEEIQQPLEFVHKINELMQQLLKKLLTKKNLAAFVVALVSILIIRYVWHIGKAIKNKEEEPVRKQHITKRIIKYIINQFNYARVLSFKLIVEIFKQIKEILYTCKVKIQFALNGLLLVSKKVFIRLKEILNLLVLVSKKRFIILFKIIKYLLSKIYNSLTVKFLKITVFVLFFITIVFSILICVFFLIGIKNIRLPVTS